MQMSSHDCELEANFPTRGSGGESDTSVSPARTFRKSLLSLICLLLLQPASTVQALSAVGPPVFSVPHGFFDAPFELELRAGRGKAKIRYTLDFSTPTPSHGILYKEPISITDTTIVRAVAYTSETAQSQSVSQSYLFPASIRQQSNNPGRGWPERFAENNSNGGPYPAYYEMAPEIADHPANRDRIEAALLAIPSISLVTDLPNLWDLSTGIYYNSEDKGRLREKPVSFEWIDPNGTGPGTTINAGLRMHGQASRKPIRTPKRSLRLYFRSVYGRSKLNFKVFDQEGTVSSFDRILLRNGGNRSYPYFDLYQRREADYINDEFSRRTFHEMGWLTAHGTPAHLYLNGLYWGLYNVTERLDDKFLVSYVGGVESDYDLVKPDEDFDDAPTAAAGTIDAWFQLQSLVNDNTITDELYQQVLEQLNVVNLVDYMILLHYIGNTDWPRHNWLTYRKRFGADTRFHMLVWDSDTSLNRVDENMSLANSANSPAALFLKLIEDNTEFRQLVAERARHHLERSDGALTPGACKRRYQQLADSIDLAIMGESARWGAYARKIYPGMEIRIARETLPAYFHSRDLSVADSDPGDLVEDRMQKSWIQVRDLKLDDDCPKRSGVLRQQYVENGWLE
jgi:hypothetical protein